MKGKRLWIFLGMAVLLMAGDRIFGWSAWLTGGAAISTLQNLLEDHLGLAMGLYTLLTVVGCVLLALPGVTFALAAGVLFGPLWGTLACWAATTVGACLSFVAGRYFLKDTLKPKLEQNIYLKRLLFDETGRSDVYLLAVTRLVPLFPFNLQNFAYGVTNIGFVPYALYSALFMLPGTAVYTVAAAGILDGERRMGYLLCAGGLLIVVLLVSRWLKRSVVRE